MSYRGFDSVICFGGEDWWYHNRGHIDMQLMRRFSRLVPTVYINSIVMQKPNLAQGRKFIQKLCRKAKSIFTGLRRTEAGFWVYSPFSLPVQHIHWLRPFNELVMRMQIAVVRRKLGLRNPIVWVACPAACNVALKMRKAKLVYQRTDRFEEFPGVDVDTIKGFDQTLKSQADLTVFVNNTLFGEESGQCRKAMYLDHGVDYEMFAFAEQDPHRPADIADIPKPIIGFYGGFAEHTTDIALLEKIVDLLPQRSFVFVGQASQECNGLKTRKNVWMLGQKPYEQIPHYGKCFDVAIMPWRQNRWIQACNPIKLKEYLALGKPIVSTPFNELNKYLDVLYEARTAEDFARAVEKALAEDNPERVATRRSRVMNASWDSKAQKVIDELYADKGESR
jgi:glycosyltransferase involved in cell wall biosynthesis